MDSLAEIDSILGWPAWAAPRVELRTKMKRKSCTVGWIGAGTMGSRMAGNLARAGYKVKIFNRSSNARGLRVAADMGCVTVPSISDVVCGSEMIFTCVSDGDALESVLFAPELNLKHLTAPNALVVDVSTIGPLAARSVGERLERFGIHFLDAPMTGGDTGAQNATLTFFVGGRLVDLNRVLPLLETIGKRVFHAGQVGSGQSLKLVNQLLCAANLVAVIEALNFAEALGLEKDLIVDGCGSGAAASWQLVNLGRKIIQKDDRPGFKVKDMTKDLRLVQQAVKSSRLENDLPCFAAALCAFEGLMKTANAGEMGTQAIHHRAGTV